MSIATAAALEEVLAQADQAARMMRTASPSRRAAWLRSAADALDAAKDALVPLAHRESHLPETRLTGELARTTFQARLFAQRLEEGRLSDPRIDLADPAWPMGARPDIRRTQVPIGPVAVFAASNFPFAFSVFGGDTVSALAAGCPVVVKAHPGHPGLSRETAEFVARALTHAGAPQGALALIEGDESGAAVVQDTRIKAVGFTGSARVGRILFDLAAGRPDPIPFYGELGSTNPVVVTPAGWASRGQEIAEGFVQSFTLGSGQFCTKPGFVFVPDAGALVERMPELTAGPLLNERIKDGYERTLSRLAATAGVEVAVRGQATPDGVTPTLLRTTVAAVLADPGILEIECFGPAAVACEYADAADIVAVLRGFGGSLTGTVQGADDSDPDAAAFIDLLSEHAGRVIWNQWPTGVTVSDGQQHGGPWPATTAPTTTSVGTAAVQRFQRPVAYQNVPQAALPPELRD